MKTITPNIAATALLAVSIIILPSVAEAAPFQGYPFSGGNWVVIQNSGSDGPGYGGAYQFNPSETFGNGIIAQTFDTSIGTTYSVSFNYGSLGGYQTINNIQQLQAEVRDGVSATNGNEIIIADSAEVAPGAKDGFSMSQTGPLVTVTDTNASNPDAFSTVTFRFVAQSGSSTIVFSDQTGSAGAWTDGLLSGVLVQVTGLQIQQQPQSQIGYWGKTASFSVSATNYSTAALNYQWLKDSTSIPDATNSTLVFTNLQLTNAGAYIVIVSDSAGNSITSAPPAILTMNPAGVSSRFMPA